MPTLVSVFDRPQDVASAVKKLKGRGFDDIETYSPAPFEEIDDAVDSKPSRVRLFTLIGGLTGVVTGFFIQIWMSLDWPVKIAGKPFASIPPYVIIGFELTILGIESDDTVFSAIGRTADTRALGLEAAGVTADKNGKLSCVNEQAPGAAHIYAIGDVVQGMPELTPVAIQARALLPLRHSRARMHT